MSELLIDKMFNWNILAFNNGKCGVIMLAIHSLLELQVNCSSGYVAAGSWNDLSLR